jgi:stage III sporulation protein AB
MLCQKFDVEINYSRERVKNIFLGIDEKQKANLKGIDVNYLEYINKGYVLDKDSLFKNITFLKEEEKDVILMFFRSLGRSDVDSQSKEIKNFQNRFESLSTSANGENKKYGTLSIKLGVVCALAVAVILI